MIAKLKEILKLSGGDWQITLITSFNPVQLYYRLKDAPVSVEIKKASKARSKTANDFCWAMCTDIGKALVPPVPKEEIYRRAIRDVGEYEPLPIRADAVDTFCKRWATKGIGWFAEIVDDSKLSGYKLVFAYYGSSTYTAESMSRVLEHLKQDMISMELPIPISKKDEERMLFEWGKASCKKNESAISAEE